MRSLIRSTAAALLAVVVATCSDATTGPVPVATGAGNIALSAVLSTGSAVARLADFGITVDHIRIVVVRAPADTVKDTTLVFAPGRPDVTLDLAVALRVPNETFTGIVEFTSIANGVVLRGEAKVHARAANQAMPSPQPIVITYAGAGASAARIIVAPKTVALTGLAEQTFTITAVDAGGAAVAAGPVHWTTSDASMATISATGQLQPTGKRGSVTVTAVTLADITDNATATISPPATAIVVVSGANQTGKVGTALAAPGVVRVMAADGLGVSGVSVLFAAPIGGAVGAGSVATDANGLASTSLTLGTVTGAEGFAVVAGTMSVSIPAVATAGDPATIVAVSGGGQADTVRRPLTAPLIAMVSDAFGNAVPNVPVSWTRVGAGTLRVASTLTGADGRASATYTLGGTVGNETITASAAGKTTTFVVQAIAEPAAIATVSGGRQSGRVLQVLAAPFIAKVTDDAGNAVGGVIVTWTATNGTIAATTTTDAAGLSSNVMTLGNVVGAASATASIARGNAVTFVATVQAGIVAKIVFRTGPASGIVNAILSPVQIELQDAFGNLVNAVNPVTIALGANPSGATLGGSLTRSAVDGVATFDNLALDKTGAYSLTASSGAMAPITSASFTIGAPTTATQLLLLPATPTSIVLQAGAALSGQPVVKAADANGTAVANISVHVAFARSSNPLVILGQSTLTTDASGIATGIVGVIGTPPTSAGVYTITVTSPSISGASIVLAVTVQAGAASTLAIATPPSSGAVSGVALLAQPVIQIQDAFGNVTSAGALAVTATPSAGTASGNAVAANATTGTATFASLTLTGIGSVTLAFSATGLQSVTSGAIAMSNTMPTQLTLVPASPASVTFQAGVAPASSPSFKVADAGGVGIAGIPVRVLTQNSVPATVSDVALTTDANGLVTATGNLPTTAGTYTVTATSSSISGASAALSLTMIAGTATKLAFTVPGATTGYSASAGQSIATPAIVVAVEDQFNNLVTTSAAPVSVAITSGAGASGAVLSGTTSLAAASGLATFTNLSLNLPSSTYTLTAAASGLASVVSLPIAIVTGPPAQLAFITQPTATLPGATISSFVVRLLDQSGNLTTGTNSVSLSVATGTSGAVLSGATVTAVNGNATFGAFSIDREGTYTLSATGTGLTAATSNAFLMSNEHAMAFAQSPSATQTNGFILSPQPTIQLNDGTAGHNPVLKAGVVITATVSAAPGSTGGIANNIATFTRTGTVTATTDANGLATFANLGILSTQGGLTARTTFSATSGTTQTIGAIISDIVVNAGAPVSIQRATNLVLTTVVGTPFSTLLAVRLLDVAGSPVPNSAGVSISYSVPSGSCSTSAVLTTTATDGTAAPLSSSLTVPNVFGSCVVRATSSSLAGSPIDWDIVVGPASGFTWIGAIDNDYTRNFNWLAHVAPGSGAVDIFVPKSVPSSPRVLAANTVRDVTLEGGASFTVGQGVYTMTGTTSAGTGSTFTVSTGAGAMALFQGASTTLGNLNVAARTVRFSNDATITGNVVATDTATIRFVGLNHVLTVVGALTSDVGTTLQFLNTIKFTGSTFPVYGNQTTAGTPLITQISHNMSVPSGASSYVNNLLVSDAALSINGIGTTLTVGNGLDVKSSTGASGEILMNSGDPTLVVTGVAIFEGKAQNGQGLTAGTLDLRGDFIQRDRTSGSHGEFAPGPAPFLVKFTGGGSSQSVFFDHPGTSPGTESYFTNVLVVNQGGVTQQSHAYVNGGTMTVGGSPADAGSPALWSTGIGGSSLFVTGGSALVIRQSGSFTVSAGGTLDLSGGSCRAFPGSLTVTGSVQGGSCTIDPTLLGSAVIDRRAGWRYAALR